MNMIKKYDTTAGVFNGHENSHVLSALNALRISDRGIRWAIPTPFKTSSCHEFFEKQL